MLPIAWCFTVVIVIPAAGQTSETLNDAQLAAHRDTFVPAAAAGVIDSLDVQLGQQVTAGQRIGSLDRRAALAEVQVAQTAARAATIASENDIDLQIARTSRDAAARQAVRGASANTRYAGAVAAADVDRWQKEAREAALEIEKAQLALRTSQIEAESAAARVAAAQVSLADRDLVTPAGGQVVEVLVRAGEYVAAGAPIIRVVDTRRLRVECFVDGERWSPDDVGLSVEFGRGDEVAAGQIIFVSPSIDPVTGQTRLVAEIDNAEAGFRPGQMGQLIVD